MVANYYGLIELVLTAVIVLGFGIWQLRSVTKSQADDRAKAKRQSDAARHAVGEHPLDDR